MNGFRTLPFPIRTLIFSATVMNAGTFAVAPFLAVYLNQTLHFSPGLVGAILTANLVAGRVLPLFGGLLGDRISHSWLLLLGLLLRALGFVGYGLSQDFVWLLTSAIVVGAGGALYEPSSNSIFASQPKEQRKQGFTFFNQALNMGAMLGPLLGSFLITREPRAPFFASSALVLVLFGLLYVQRHHFRTASTREAVHLSLQGVVQNRTFVEFALVMSLFYFMFAQLTLSLPLQAVHLGGAPAFAGSILLVNGAVGLLAMVFLRRLFQTREPSHLVKLGVLMVSIGLLMVSALPSLPWLLWCVAVYSVGETLVLPAASLLISDLSGERNRGVYFGAYNLAWALGGTVGNFTGAYLMLEWGGPFPWMLYGGVGIVAYFLLKRVLTSARADTLLAQEGQSLPSAER